MNERIKELAMRIGYYDEYCPLTEWDYRKLDEFAELIVKECANWIENTDSDPDIGADDARALLNHFGIKE